MDGRCKPAQRQINQAIEDNLDELIEWLAHEALQPDSRFHRDLWGDEAAKSSLLKHTIGEYAKHRDRRVKVA